MDRSAVSAELRTIFQTVLGDSDFSPTDDMETGAHPDWNSVANIEILITCEETWDFEFRSVEIDEIKSFGDLTDAVVTKLG